jgi:hypothetical protein
MLLNKCRFPEIAGLTPEAVGDPRCSMKLGHARTNDF